MTKRLPILVLCMLSGCVERVLTITSDPPGALVHVNQHEVGRTPLQRNFTWYGNYDVTLRKEGYETLKTNGAVHPPVWQWPVIDLVFDVLPLRLKDEHTLQYTLKPAKPADEEGVMKRADALQKKLQHSDIKPATRTSR